MKPTTKITLQPSTDGGFNIVKLVGAVDINLGNGTAGIGGYLKENEARKIADNFRVYTVTVIPNK